MPLPLSGRMLPGAMNAPGSRPDPESELDRLLNDPEVPMQAARVWALADEVAAASCAPNGA